MNKRNKQIANIISKFRLKVATIEVIEPVKLSKEEKMYFSQFFNKSSMKKLTQAKLLVQFTNGTAIEKVLK